MKHFNNYLSESKLDVKMEYREDMQLLALQGKAAHQVVARLAPSLDISKMNFMTSTITNFGGIENTRITRCGYTGEDGFEISCQSKDAAALASILFNQPEVKPAGLGARDSLRLEAGLCLYGNDLEEHITPVEAGLVWTIGGPKSRRRLEQGFLGADKILESTGKLIPVKKKRVGITGMKAPARENTAIYTADGQTKIGEITSGGFGPTYGKSLAMG
jgi:aminomethyltransferase